MPASKVTLTGGAFQDSEGNVLANGTLKFVLSQDASIAGVGSIASGIAVTVQLDANGNVAANQQIWGNDQMSPINCYYRVTGYSAAGQSVWGPNNQQVFGNGGTFSLSTWIPNQVISWNPPSSAPLLETNGVLNTKQTLLNLIGGTGITLTTDGAGGVTVASSAVSSVFSPLKRYLLNTWNETTAQFWGANTLTGPTFGTLFNSNIQGTATHPPGSQRGTTASGTASSYFISWLSAAYPVGKSLHGIAWAAPFDATTVSTTGFKIQPLVLFDQTGGNGSNYYAPSGNDATVLGNQIGFFGLTNGGTANWKAYCTAGGVQTVVDTGVPITTTGHTFEFQENPGVNVVFKIDGNIVATITTNIPASGTLMFLYGGGIQFPGALPAVQPTALFGWMFLEATF